MKFKLLMLSALVFCLCVTQIASASTKWTTSQIVAGLLCIHDGHLYTYKGGDVYRLSSYTVGKQLNWPSGFGSLSGHTDWGEGSFFDQARGLGMYDNFQAEYGSSFYHTGNWTIENILRTGVAGALANGGFHPWPNTRQPCGLPAYF